ncbi:MAG: DNA-directed RNA polymerase subunit alpha C-terminal domain-containing protein [Planctomycetales bacterium]|jgi:DNA-directed RNA polymerase subunit alpha
MMVPDSVDVSQLLVDGSSFGHNEIGELEKAIASNPHAVRQGCQELRKRVDSGSGSERDSVATGYSLYLLGNHQDAIHYLSQATGSDFAEFTRGECLCALERFDEAAEAYREAGKRGYDTVQAVLSEAGAIRMAGRIDEAEALLKANARTAVTRADYSYQMGGILADRGDTFGAIEYFERAVDMDPHHSRALFRLAALNASFGNDETARGLYERSLSRPPFYLGALINLGLLYEDAERYEAAAFCFKRVVDFDPNHERARLYLKDIEASGEMFYDEDAVRRSREEEQTLNTPIADFELSARSRNCLDRMEIHTLGDLTGISEPELLGSKNFGETSLKEVRDILDSRGLSIGMHVTDAKRLAPQQVTREDLPDEKKAVFDAPVADLNLSVRARKCVSRLNISTIGEIMNRSPDDLLGVRNFGVTSLNEIRAKLAEMGLTLRND